MLRKAIACIALSAGSLFAQCNTIEFEPIVPAPPSVDESTGVEWLDPDGPQGPIAPVMVHSTVVNGGGTFSHLYKKGEYGWAQIDSAASYGIRSMIGIKHGAAGVPIGHVVFYGNHTWIGNQQLKHVVAYDGTTARQLGNTTMEPTTAAPTSLVEWDLDGEGPELPVLVITGSFTSIGGVPARYMAIYDGQQWTAFPNSFPRQCTLEVHDQDGDGPQPPELFAFERPSSGSQNTGVYRLDEDGLWEYLGIGFGAITYHDDDGSGPNERALFHVEQTTGIPGGISIRKMVDNQWVLVPVQCARNIQNTCYSVYFTRLVSYDPDGDGPLIPELAIGGAIRSSVNHYISTFGIIRDGQFIIPPNGPYGRENSGLKILKPFDPDGPGPRETELLLAGLVSPGIMTWNGRELRILDRYFDGRLRFMVHHDIDGPGPEPTRIYGTGYIVSTEHEYAENMVVWENGRWRGLGGWTPNRRYEANALTIHDFDGSGPQPGKIVMAVQETTHRAFAWNPQLQIWDAVADPFRFSNSQNAVAMVSFDEDGPNQVAPSLFIGGDRAEYSLARVARLENRNWIDTEDGSYLLSGCISLASHDPDGTGPGLAKLIASMDNGLMQWTGTGWINFAGVNQVSNSSVHDMLSVDFDGQGPRPIELVLGVKEFRIGTTVYQGIHAYDGANWNRVGGAVPAGISGIRRLFMFDPDGPDSPAPEQLAMTCFPRGVYRLENNAWVELNSGIGNYFRSVITHVPGVEGPGPGELFLAGEYTPPNSSAPRSFAHYKLLDLAQIVQHPAAVDSSSGQDVSLSVNATGEELRYQWHRGATPVQNGPGGASVGGGTISGAQGPVLTITGINCSDAGSFSCTVSNGCSSSNSSAAAVTLRDCCTPDYNGDGGADTSDILDLAHDVASGTSTYPPNPPDFNNDGAADISDILDLANVIAGGDCP